MQNSVTSVKKNMASNTEKKLVRSKSGLRMVPADEKVQSPFTLSEPEWTPDNAVNTLLFLNYCLSNLMLCVSRVLRKLYLLSGCTYLSNVTPQRNGKHPYFAKRALEEQ